MADETTNTNTERELGIIQIQSLKLDNIDNFMDGNVHLTEVDCDFPNVESAQNAFNSCSALTSFKGKYNSLKNATGMLRKTALSSIEIGQGKDVQMTFVNNINKLLEECTSLTSATIDLPSVENAQFLFNGCSSLNSVTLNIPNVKYLNSCFSNCISLGQSSLTLNSALQLDNMYSGCTSIHAISIDAINATSAVGIISGCNSLNTLHIGLPKAELGNQFTLPNSLKTLSGSIKVNNLQFTQNLNTATIDIPNVTDGDKLISGAPNLTTIGGNWSGIISFGGKTLPKSLTTVENLNLSGLQNGNSLFKGADQIQSLSFAGTFNNLENAQYMFAYCPKTNTISLNFPKLKNAKGMFLESDDISNGDTTIIAPELEYADEMLRGVSGINPLYMDLASTISAKGMLKHCTELKRIFKADKSDLGSFPQMVDGDYMLSYTNVETFPNYSPTVTNFTMPELISGSNMFLNSKSLKQFTIVAPKLVCADGMFKNTKVQYLATAVTGYLESKLETGTLAYYISTASSMFEGCTDLRGVSSSHLNTEHLKNGASMFKNCSNLTEFGASLAELRTGKEMFCGCQLDERSLTYIESSIKNVRSYFNWSEDGTKRKESKDDNDWKYYARGSSSPTNKPAGGDGIVSLDGRITQNTIEEADRGVIHVDFHKDVSVERQQQFIDKLFEKGWTVSTCSDSINMRVDITDDNPEDSTPYTESIPSWKSKCYPILKITKIVQRAATEEEKLKCYGDYVADMIGTKTSNKQSGDSGTES